MSTLNLITDRTAADVKRWRSLRGKGWAGMTDAEQAEWLAGLKGAYNATDFNRVTAAMEYLAARLAGYGYAVDYVPVEAAEGRTEGVMTDIPTPAQKRAYLANVAALRAVLALPERTPEVPPDMDELTATQANDIERILVVIETMIGNMTQAWYFSGDLSAGEV